MEKKIKGYKLVKPEYKKAALALLDASEEAINNNVKERGRWFDFNSDWYCKAKKAGILDLWFEPIYEEDQKVFKMAEDFYVIVEDGKAFHSKDGKTKAQQQPIDAFIKEMVSTLNPIQSFGTYKATIASVTFSQTGCENKETTLSQWKEVYDALTK